MDSRPYHHLSDGTFRNPEGSPVRDSSFNWSFKIFNEEKKKLTVMVKIFGRKTPLELNYMQVEKDG